MTRRPYLDDRDPGRGEGVGRELESRNPPARPRTNRRRRESRTRQKARHDRGVRMTAPAPSPAEQAVIDRFGIFEPEARVVEEVARALEDACGDDATWLTLAAAAVTAHRAAQDGGAEHGPGKCVPMEDANRALYVAGDAEMQLEALSAQDGGAEEAVRERMAHVWADPFGQWNAEQADAARQQKAGMLRAALAPQAQR